MFSKLYTKICWKKIHHSWFDGIVNGLQSNWYYIKITGSLKFNSYILLRVSESSSSNVYVVNVTTGNDMRLRSRSRPTSFLFDFIYFFITTFSQYQKMFMNLITYPTYHHQVLTQRLHPFVKPTLSGYLGIFVLSFIKIS